MVGGGWSKQCAREGGKVESQRELRVGTREAEPLLLASHALGDHSDHQIPDCRQGNAGRRI